MLNVVWFRRDLRIADHAPLARAVSGGGMVLPLYIVEPGFWSRPVASARQWRFVARALAALRAQLAVLGAPLVVRAGEAVEVLEALRAGVRGMTLWSHEEAGDAWCRARDGRVAEWARAAGIVWHRLPPPGLFHPAAGSSWARLWAECMAEAPLSPPQAMLAHGLPPGRIPSERVVGLADDPCADLPAGPQPARRLLEIFLTERAGQHRPGRASVAGAAEACSHLSPHLAWGTISGREAVHAARGKRDGLPPGDQRRGVDSFLLRLRARSRSIQRLEDEPAIEDRCIDPLFDRLRGDGNWSHLHAWAEGRTGLPLVDAGMRALAATGWLPFRARALCASFAAHQLWLDWRLFGPVLARLFTDFEPGIHWVQCQVQSGTAGGVPRVPEPAAESMRLDPQGDFVRQWVPELARVPAHAVHEPWRLSLLEQAEAGCRIGADHPAPIVEPYEATRRAREHFSALRHVGGPAPETGEGPAVPVLSPSAGGPRAGGTEPARQVQARPSRQSRRRPG